MAGKKNEKAKGKSKNTGAEQASSSTQKGGKEKPKAATSINVRHILCEKHSKKEEALTKIREGAKFDDVAREMSEDKGRQGGSLGWKTRGSLEAEFEKVAYELTPSSTNNAVIGEVKTQHGYHLIMVEARK